MVILLLLGIAAKQDARIYFNLSVCQYVGSAYDVVVVCSVQFAFV